jgi:hypothetical protein
MKKYKYEIIFASIFIIIYFCFGNIILSTIFISDECYYHSNDVPFLINLLFDFPSSEGYHPVATKLGYLLFGIIGLIVGRRRSKRIATNKNINN